MITFMARVGAGILGISLAGGAANATDIKILSSVRMKAIMEELGPQFERTTGHKLVMNFGIANVLKRQIDAGEPFDVAILTPPLIDELVKASKIAAGTRADIARIGIGVAIRAGAPKPDISTTEAFKSALLNAKSITFTKEGTSEIKPLLTGGRVAEFVAKGEAELGIALINEIPSFPGAELLGPLPPEVQDFTVFATGVGANAKEPEAGGVLIKFLTAPSAASVIKGKGMEPVR
jgi:molybdate transport system substrate-binding protein